MNLHGEEQCAAYLSRVKDAILRERRERIATAVLPGLLAQFVSIETDSGSRELEPLYLDSDNDTCVTRALDLADELIRQLDEAK